MKMRKKRVEENVSVLQLEFLRLVFLRQQGAGNVGDLVVLTWLRVCLLYCIAAHFILLTVNAMNEGCHCIQRLPYHVIQGI